MGFEKNEQRAPVFKYPPTDSYTFPISQCESYSFKAHTFLSWGFLNGSAMQVKVPTRTSDLFFNKPCGWIRARMYYLILNSTALLLIYPLVQFLIKKRLLLLILYIQKGISTWRCETLKDFFLEQICYETNHFAHLPLSRTLWFIKHFSFIIPLGLYRQVAPPFYR